MIMIFFWKLGVKMYVSNEQVKTSSARSATLGDISWARLTTELTSWNLPDYQLCLKSKTEQRHQTTLGGGHCMKTKIY